MTEFKSACDTLRDVLEFIKTSNPEPRLRLVMLNNNIVALTATIEETVRTMNEVYLNILEEYIPDFRDLNEGVRKSNIEGAIHIIKNDSKSDYRRAQVTSGNLSKCFNGAIGYKIHTEFITYNQGNFKSPQITESAKMLGIANIWDSICDNSEIEDYTGIAAVPSRVTNIVKEWNAIFEERDTVVHRLSQASGWSSDRISAAIYLGVLIVSSMGNCLIVECNTYLEKMRRAGKALPV